MALSFVFIWSSFAFLHSFGCIRVTYICLYGLVHVCLILSYLYLFLSIVIIIIIVLFSFFLLFFLALVCTLHKPCLYLTHVSKRREVLAPEAKPKWECKVSKKPKFITSDYRSDYLVSIFARCCRMPISSFVFFCVLFYFFLSSHSGIILLIFSSSAAAPTRTTTAKCKSLSLRFSKSHAGMA